ncbi:hypothetical protein ACU8V3_03090 [Cobetia marina]
MKSLKENAVPVKRTIRLMIETTEETGGDGFAYYKAHNALPEYNIVLDSGYPAITAENGFGTIDARFPLARETQTGQAADGLPAITSFKGDLRPTRFPSAPSPPCTPVMPRVPRRSTTSWKRLAAVTSTSTARISASPVK